MPTVTFVLTLFNYEKHIKELSNASISDGGKVTLEYFTAIVESIDYINSFLEKLSSMLIFVLESKFI
jgi:hypothetical protein